jgi:hypothetical protein
MAMSKQTKIMIGVGVAAVAAYLIYQKYYATAATTTTLPTSGGSTALPATTTPLPPWSDPANAAIVQSIQGWISQTPANWQTSINAYMPSASITDINNLYTVIQNYFNKGINLATNPSLATWWNTFSAVNNLNG